MRTGYEVHKVDAAWITCLRCAKAELIYGTDVTHDLDVWADWHEQTVHDGPESPTEEP